MDFQQLRMLKVLLFLTGVAKKSIVDEQWKNARKLYVKHIALQEAMASIWEMQETKEMSKRWEETASLLRGMDFVALTKRSPASLVVVLRWLQAVLMVNTISKAIEQEMRPAPPDPVADAIFDTIDVNNDGSIASSELIKYMLREFPSNVAHTLLATLDVDNNGHIDRFEWRKGWKAGLLSKVLLKAQK